jgi:Fe-S-cluster containining protein
MNQVPVTSNLMQMIEGFSEEQKAYVGEKIRFYINQYKQARKKHGNVSTAYSFHEAIEAELNKQETKDNPYFKRIACKKGCGFCCFVNVDINEDEAELILGYIQEKQIPINLELLRKQATKRDKTYNELPVAERKCTFLGKDMTCNIYEHRPAACRKFFALDTNEVCAKGDEGAVHELFGSLMLEVLQTAIYQGARTENMPKLLLELIDKRKQ